ncbi:MAG TPA: carboxylesterase family protein [Bryobacteraceae bacterium]|nr:carboxylesterase family protein [Bryobacteraceae bacterium]
MLRKTAFLSLGFVLWTVALNAQDSLLSPTRPVRTTQGLVLGLSDGRVDQFLGVPYAAPPVGDLRWKPPAEAPSWNAIRDAIQQESECSQPSGGSEDCLYLNIYRPAGAKPGQSLPVIVFIHGGSNQIGSGNQYDPSDWAASTGLIVVTINYRLNVFGFLALPSLDAEAGEPSSGNYGLMDQQAALRWVNANIRAFGGDQDNVTIQGESAGGVDVCANLVSPTAAGLFTKAIMESMYCPTATHDQAIQTSAPVAAALGCTDAQTAAACMQNKSAANVLAAAGHLSMAGEAGFMPSPNFGSSVLPLLAPDALSAGQWNRSSILIGSNHDDASPFVSAALDARKVQFPITVQEYQTLVSAQYGSFASAVLMEYPLSNYSDPFLAYADEITDYSALGCPVTPLSQMFAAVAPTFRYEFDDPAAIAQGANPTDRTLGAYHGAELLYLFTIASVSETPAQQQLSKEMRQYWTNFARTGNPNGTDLIYWPPYDANAHQLLALIPAGNTAVDNFDGEHHCAFWAAAPGPH